MSTQQLLFDPLKDEVEKVQKKCLKYDDQKITNPCDLSNSIVSKITDYDEAVTHAALGPKLANRLRAFSSQVDLKHPGLVDLFEGQLVDGNFSKDCCDLLSLAKHASVNEPRLFTRIKEILSKTGLYRKVLRSIDAPGENQLHVRFVGDRKKRNSIRATKRMQPVVISHIERKKKDYDIWSCHNPTFENYVRHCNIWEEEIKEAKQEMKRFEKMNCKDLANGIQRDIDNFESQSKDSYFGFNHIFTTHAVVILAKIHGYTIKKRPNGTHRILVHRGHFGEHSNFCATSTGETTDLSWFEYEPRSYTINEFQSNNIMSDDMQKLVNYLENFPGVGGRPIFDHFRVLVPGVKYPFESGVTSYMDGKEKITLLASDAKKQIDMMFVKNGVYCPILIGQKDEHCYFLSYWI